MDTVIYGLLSAAGWGISDFVARYTSQSIGHTRSLMIMLGTSCVGLSIYMMSTGATPNILILETTEILHLAITGAIIALALFFIYWGLERGPVSIVAPIVCAYPAVNLIIAFAIGVRPNPIEWVSMVMVIVGVIAVAKTGDRSGNQEHLTITIIIAFLAMLFSAIGFALLAEMSYKYGDQNAVLMTRWITFSAAMLLVFVLKTPDDIPITYVYRNKKIALLLLVQGGLDVLAYISIAIGSKAPMGVVTIVIASTFGVITTLLARFILTESVSYFQWVGIGLIGVGVSTISYYSY